MVVKPYTWVSWSDARSRMPEICSGWSWDSEHADKAMVSSLRGDPLRSRNVPVRGGAQVADADLMAMRSVPLKDVAAGLLSTNGYSAEYEVTRLSAGLTVGRMLLPPQHVTDRKNAMLSGAQLAWEAFRDDLIRYELPDGAKPNPDSDETPVGDQRYHLPRQRGAYKGALAEWMARKGIQLLRRMTPPAIATDFKSYCESKRRDLLSVLPKRLRSMEPEIARIIDKMAAAAAIGESKKTATKGQ